MPELKVKMAEVGSARTRPPDDLARRELIVAFEELHQRLPLLRSTAEPDYLQSNFINGIKRLPCTWN